MALSPDAKKSMLILREAGVSDSVIGKAFGLTRQGVHSLLGARDPSVPTLVVPSRKGKAIPPHDLDVLPDEPNETLALRLYEWRTRRNLSQTDAAAIIGITNVAWSTWERGARGCVLPGVMLRILELTDKLDKMDDLAQ